MYLNNAELKKLQITFVPNIFLNMKLKDMYCKHVLSLSVKAQMLLQESLQIGYKYCQWGSHELDKDSLDLFYHARKIENMERKKYEHAIRIVICKYPFLNNPIVWVDNLHSAILQMRKHGLDVTLKEIPFYIVDISEYNHPIIMSHNNSFIDTEENRNGVLYCAYKRYERSNNKELISLNYKISDFVNDNYELYTFHNKILCKLKDNLEPKDLIHRSMAFNSFWER